MISINRLTNAEDSARNNPLTFEIPERSKREALLPGDLCKLVFDNAERMWVSIIEKLSPEGFYLGNLANVPIVIGDAEYGESVMFRPENIIQIQRKQ